MNGNGALSWLKPEDPYLHQPRCDNKNLHCARPIPGHGRDRTLFHQGVSVADFFIFFSNVAFPELTVKGGEGGGKLGKKTAHAWCKSC